MSEIKLTVSQIASEIGESPHVIRNWVKDFKAYLPLEKSAGGYNLFNQDCIDVMMSIKKMHREQNLTVRQIEAILSGADKPIFKNDETAVTLETFEGVKELLEEQRNFNAALLQQLQRQQDSFESFVQKRDEQIMYILGELREERNDKRNKKNKGWLKGLLKGGH